MLSIRKTYFWIFLYILLIQIPAPTLLKPVDEVGVLFMLLLIGLDVAVNRQISRYKGLFIVVGIMLFYAIYSMAFLKFNTTRAILTDFVIESKPFVPFFISYAIGPRFTAKEKQILRWASIIVSILLLLIFATGTIKPIIHHPAYIGSTAFICFLTYIFCSIQDDNTISRRDLCIASIILGIGLCSTRSKYYGEAVMAIYMIYLYKPGVFKKIKLKQVIIAIFAIIAVFIVSWKKINFYFIQGTEGAIDAGIIQSFARPALLGGMFLLLCDYPIFGTGLASYATYASAPDVNYSTLYAIYDLDKVFGLSEDFPYFICDCFYAEFAQFGLVGIGLFIYFFVWIYQQLRLVLHDESHYTFAIGIMVIVYMLIENVGGTLFSQASGVYLMALLGTIVGKYRHCDKQQRDAILLQDYK